MNWYKRSSVLNTFMSNAVEAISEFVKAKIPYDEITQKNMENILINEIKDKIRACEPNCEDAFLSNMWEELQDRASELLRSHSMGLE